LATAPQLYEPIITYLGEYCLHVSDDLMRNIVIEKPFGQDLASAQKLNALLHEYFKEEQIFRIDHYLGKETAQNILFFRFANSIFEPLWNRRYIDSVHINVAESGTIHYRAGYYDKAGILRDMFQNHLLQLLTLVAMEPPASFEASSLQYEKMKVLQSLRPADPDYITFGQYEGYLEAPGVAENSRTPTYSLVPTYVDNWRWQGVPFYLRSGKALKEKTSQITIEFRCPPHLLFDKNGGFEPNKIVIQIQPNEGIQLRFETKKPNSAQQTVTTSMDFNYQTGLKDMRLPTAYERLLRDALLGDTSLFTHAREIELSWKFIDPIIQYWEENTDQAPMRYKPGTM
jgi:glucose-6-phosphate 1-dehydrogenase